jgi:hypothetical protein
MQKQLSEMNINKILTHGCSTSPVRKEGEAVDLGPQRTTGLNKLGFVIVAELARQFELLTPWKQSIILTFV